MTNPRAPRAYQLLTAIAIAVGVVACGGDGSADPDNGSPTVPAEVALAKGTVTVNDVARDYQYYLPSNIDALKAFNIKNIRVVVSFHDDGQTAQDNAQQTRWHELAEANGFVVIYPSAANGRWNLKDSAAELAYVHAAWSDIRAKFNVSDTNAVYPTGFGAGASMAHQLAMMGPVIGYMPPIAAVAGIDGVADPSVFALPKTHYTYPELPGAVERAENTPFGGSLPDTAMSVWLLSTKAGTDVSQQADYWKIQNTVRATPVATSDTAFDTTTYRNADNAFQEVRISKARASSLSGKALSEYLWTNMFSKVIRFKNDDRVNGTLVAMKSESELGLIDTTRKFSEAAKGDRRFLTYLPKDYAARVARGEKLPLVLNFHGIRGSGWWQAINTDYVPAAEKHGFIAVFPQGLDSVFSSTINRDTPAVNYDVQYIVELLDHLKTQYQVDSTRVFATGVSAGAAFTNRVIVEYPQLFAGAAPCYSGYLSATVYQNYRSYPQIRTDVPLPIWHAVAAPSRTAPSQVAAPARRLAASSGA